MSILKHFRYLYKKVPVLDKRKLHPKKNFHQTPFFFFKKIIFKLRRRSATQAEKNGRNVCLIEQLKIN